VKGNQFFSNEKNPSIDINIDNLSDINYKIYIKTKDENESIYLTTDDEEHVYRDIHPGAIYLYKANQYYVEKVDFEKKEVFLTKAKRNYFTVSVYETEIKRLKQISHKQFGIDHKLQVFYGIVNVKQKFHSYNKLQNVTQEIIETKDLSMPDLKFNTESMWLLIPNKYLKILKNKGFDIEGSLHALLHSLIHMVPVQAQIDRYDIDGIFLEEEPKYKQAIIYIFDAYKEGIGIAERIYEKINDLLSMAYSLIKNCPCTSKKGCPACIMATNCVKRNDPLIKKGALALLELLMEGSTKLTTKIR
jgi:DEAD/DEAH box helicase domain-containing protein